MRAHRACFLVLLRDGTGRGGAIRGGAGVVSCRWRQGGTGRGGVARNGVGGSVSSQARARAGCRCGIRPVRGGAVRGGPSRARAVQGGPLWAGAVRAGTVRVGTGVGGTGRDGAVRPVPGRPITAWHGPVRYGPGWEGQAQWVGLCERGRGASIAATGRAVTGRDGKGCLGRALRDGTGWGCTGWGGVGWAGAGWYLRALSLG